MKWAAVSLLLAGVLVSAAQSQIQPKIYSNIDDTNKGWGSCSACAGGRNNADIYWMAPFQTSPSRDGASTQLYVSASKPYSNVLFWQKMGPQDFATHFTWDFWVLLGSNSVGAEALEYDLFQFVGGVEYMFGTECVYSTGHWDVWNGATGKWTPTQLPCRTFKPNVWHHVVWKFHRTSDTRMHYDYLTVDGVQYSVNLSEPSGPLPSGWTDNFGVQWQLDTAANPLTFSEWVDEVKLTIQ